MPTLFLSKQCVIFDVLTFNAAKCESDAVCLQTFIGKQFCIAAAGLLKLAGGASGVYLVDFTAKQFCMNGVAMLVPLFYTMGTGLWYAPLHGLSVTVA